MPHPVDEKKLTRVRGLMAEEELEALAIEPGAYCRIPDDFRLAAAGVKG